MRLMILADPLEHVLPHPVFGDHLPWFTNLCLMTLLVGIAMLLIFPRMFSKPDTNAPHGFKNAFEALLEFMRNEVFRPALKERTDEYLPFLWTLFVFILFSNLLGCIPLADIIELITGGRIQHFGGAPTSGITTTATLAVIAFFYIHFHGIGVLYRSLVDGTYGHGHHHDAAEAHSGVEAPHDEPHTPMPAGKAALMVVPLYFWNFAPHPFRDKGLLFDFPMFLFLLVLEIVGAFIKPFALCMRLFANMVAGQVVLAVLISLIVSIPSLLGQFAVGIPLGFLHLSIQFLELFVAVLQTYIFTFLTTLFIASAVAPEH